MSFLISALTFLTDVVLAACVLLLSVIVMMGFVIILIEVLAYGVALILHLISSFKDSVKAIKDDFYMD